MKKYLRVTSSMHSLSASPSSLPDINPVQQQDDNGEDEEFSIFHQWSQLLSELFDIFNWYEGALNSEAGQSTVRNMMGTSIFTGTEAKETIKVRGC